MEALETLSDRIRTLASSGSDTNLIWYIFGAILLYFFIFSGILIYHWTQYGTGKYTGPIAITVYVSVSAVLIAAMLVSALLLTGIL